MLTQCEDKLVKSLQNSATFQAMSGKVYVDEFPDPNNSTRDEYETVEFDNLFPAALIHEPDEGGINYTHEADGGAFGYIYSIRLNVEIQAERDLNMTTQDAARTFKNNVCGILEDILADSGKDDRFAISAAVKQVAQWLEPDVVSNNQRMATVLELEYNIGE